MKTIISVLCLACWASSAIAQFSPKFIINPTLLQFQTVSIGDSLDKNITFRVDSTAANDVNVSMSAPLSANYKYVGASSFTVKKGTTYTLTVRCKPTVLGALRDTVFATHNGDTTFSKNPTRITFGGQGIAKDTFPKIQVTSQNGLNFGTDSSGTVTTKSFYIINTTDTVKTLTGNISALKNAAYSYLTLPGTFSLNQGDSLKVTIAFTAPAKQGTYRDTITITSNSNPSTATIKVPITAFVPGPDTVAKILVNPSRFLFFGPVAVGKSKQMTVSIKNTTNTNLTLTGTVASTNRSHSYSIASGGGPFSLAQGDSTHVIINFAPDTISNALVDTLVITSNSDPTNQRITELLFGSGVAPDTLPRFALTGAQNSPNGVRLNFGTAPIGVPTTKTLTITNTSDGNIGKLSGSVGGFTAPQFVVTSGGGAYALDSGKAQTITITFTPTALPQVSDTLVITSNDSANKLVKVIVSGSGRADTSAKITLSSTTIDFGQVAVGQNPVSRTFTITNSSDTSRPLIGSVGYPIAPFRLANGGGNYSLAQGAAATDTVVLTPVVAGTYDDSIIVTSNSDISTSRIVVHLHGVVLADRVAESHKVGAVSLYPNPVSSTARVRFTLTEDARVSARVFDALGNTLLTASDAFYSGGEHEFELETSTLPNGTYYLRLEMADGTKTIRFVVTK